MKQGVADAVSNDFDDFDDEDCSDIEDDDGQEEYSEAKDSFGWVIEESDLLVDDATLQEYESDEEDEPAKPVKANDPKVRKFQRGLAKCLQNLCKFAANPDLVDALNGDEKLTSPFHRSRRNRYKVMHNNPQAQENLLEEFFNRIPLHTQQILGGSDRSLEAMSALPKGRESTRKSYKAGLPGAPRRRFWKWTEKRAVYASFVEIGGKVEPYAGKAGGTGTTVKGYRGFNGRAKGYMETRRTGKIQGRDVPHTRAIRDGARWKLRLICTFEDDCAVQKILILEELMTLYLRCFKRNGEYNGRRTLQMCNLVEACTPSELPDWDHVGLNATFQSVDPLLYDKDRRCQNCQKTKADILASGKQHAKWVPLDLDTPFDVLHCRDCEIAARIVAGLCRSCGGPREDDEAARCSRCIGVKNAWAAKLTAQGLCECKKPLAPPDENGRQGKRCADCVAHDKDYQATQNAKFKAARNTPKPGNSKAELDSDIQKLITVLKEPGRSVKGSYPLTKLRLAFPHDLNTSGRIDKNSRFKHLSKQYWRDAGISEAFITRMMNPTLVKVATGKSSISAYFGK